MTDNNQDLIILISELTKVIETQSEQIKSLKCEVATFKKDLANFRIETSRLLGINFMKSKRSSLEDPFKEDCYPRQDLLKKRSFTASEIPRKHSIAPIIIKGNLSISDPHPRYIDHCIFRDTI
jgi:hypothetical protein